MKIAGYEVHPAAELFPMLDEDALKRLAEDIKANGMRVPAVLLDGKILDGRNRLKACELAGVTPRLQTHVGDNPWRTVWSLNAERRQIEDKLRLALIGKAMLQGSDAWEKAQKKAASEASEAHRETIKAQPRGADGRVRAVPASREAKTEERNHAAESARKASARLAAEVGVSRATVERALELERKRPEAVAEVMRGGVSGAAVLAEVKRAERMERMSEISEGNAPMEGLGRFGVLYADPPWRYEHVETESRAIENQYPTMDLDAIRALPVSDLATDDSVLFLWATSPKLAEALSVLEAWGFEYRTCAVWDKEKIGMGYYFRQQHELLLVGVRGSPPTPAPDCRPSSVFRETRGKHSAKPAAFAEMIEAMYPGVSKVELFCRTPRAGWSVWGNQS